MISPIFQMSFDDLKFKIGHDVPLNPVALALHSNVIKSNQVRFLNYTELVFVIIATCNVTL